MSSVSATKSVSVPELDYDQTLQQLSTLNDDDVLCIEDGRLCAWKKDSGSGGPNTNAVMLAVKDMLTKKMGDGVFGSSDISKGLKIINDLKNSASNNKNNYWYAGDMKKLLSGFKDINSKPGAKTQAPANTKTPAKTQEPAKTEVKTETKTEETKGAGSVPKPGETLTMTRAELEKNLDSWIKAGFRVTVEVENKGSYQLQGRSETDKKPHMYDALYTSADGTVSNEKCLFELPDSSYAVSQPTAKTEVAKTEVTKTEVKKTESAKPNDTTNKTIKVTIKDSKSVNKPQYDFVKAQTPNSNTCFLWSLRNAILSAKEAQELKKIMAWNDSQENSDKICVYEKGVLKNYKVADWETVVKDHRKRGKEFLERCNTLKLQPFEKKFLLYLYATDKDYEKRCDEALDRRDVLPAYESSRLAPMFGLQANADAQFTKDKQPSPETLKPIKEALDKGGFVTMNVDNKHYVSVLNVNSEAGTVECLDSLHKPGQKIEFDIKHILTYNTSVSFVAYGPQVDKVKTAKADFVAYLQDQALFSSTSKLNKQLEERFGKGSDMQNALYQKNFIFDVAVKLFAMSQQEQQKLFEKAEVKECLNNLESNLQKALDVKEYLSAIAEVCTSLDIVKVESN